MRRMLVLSIGCRFDDLSSIPDSGALSELAPLDQATLEGEVLQWVNLARRDGATCGSLVMSGGQAPLELDPLLLEVARAHSEDMSDRVFFDHVNPDGDDPAERMRAAGFEGDFPWGENIASGTSDAALVVELWLASPGHCENIMRPDFQVIGVGFFGEGAKPYWTQEFAGSH